MNQLSLEEEEDEADSGTVVNQLSLEEEDEADSGTVVNQLSLEEEEDEANSGTFFV